MSETSSSELDDADTEGLKKECENKKDSLKEKTKAYEESRKACWVGTKECKVQEAQSDVTQALSETSAANLQLEMLQFQFGANAQMKGQIDVVLAKLKEESKELERQLEESEPSSGSPLVENVGTTEALDLKEIQDNWAMFEFSSTKSSKETHSFSMETSSTVSASYMGYGGSVSASVGHQSFSEHVRSADVKVKAKVLKVKINRPWFRPDLFLNAEFKLQRTEALISPGPMIEKNFYSEVSREGASYMLYQYPTAFLLAKEVSMEFSGLDAKTKQTALSTSFGVAAKGGWGPFSFGVSASGATSSSSMQASSTADGLKIDIPGAQLIGYYCDVVPKFPNPGAILRN